MSEKSAELSGVPKGTPDPAPPAPAQADTEGASPKKKTPAEKAAEARAARKKAAEEAATQAAAEEKAAADARRDEEARKVRKRGGVTKLLAIAATIAMVVLTVGLVMFGGTPERQSAGVSDNGGGLTVVTNSCGEPLSILVSYGKKERVTMRHGCAFDMARGPGGTLEMFADGTPIKSWPEQDPGYTWEVTSVNVLDLQRKEALGQPILVTFSWRPK